MLTPQTWGNSDYDDEWDVFEDWIDEYDQMDLDLNVAVCNGKSLSFEFISTTSETWLHILTFQLLVREARKDEY